MAPLLVLVGVVIADKIYRRWYSVLVAIAIVAATLLSAIVTLTPTVICETASDAPNQTQQKKPEPVKSLSPVLPQTPSTDASPQPSQEDPEVPDFGDSWDELA